MATILIVGADRGIAHAAAIQLRERRDHVIAACLGTGEDLAALGCEVVPRIDVTSDQAVARLASALDKKAVKLDWLFHVAGVLGMDEFGRIDFQDMRRQFEINTLGPLRIAQAVAPFLGNGAKVGIVTSRVGSLSDNSSGGIYAYRVSKAAANMVTLNLHHDLTKRGIAVVALHPGMVATDLTKDYPGNFAYIQPNEAAAGLITRMDALTLETSGQFRHANGDQLPW